MGQKEVGKARRKGRSMLLFLAACAMVMMSNGAALAEPPAHRVYQSSRFSIDEILARPYSPEVPMGCVGDRLWATSPQGWAFDGGVHFIYLTDLKPFDIRIEVGGREVVPTTATYRPSHISMIGGWAVGPRASASFTFAIDGVERPLTRPFERNKRWTCWSSGKRTDWYAVDFGRRRRIEGLTVYFYDDAPRGGCRPPEWFKVQYWDGRQWRDVSGAKFSPEKPAPDRNEVAFEPVETKRVRLLLRNRGKEFYTGIYGIEFRAEDVGKTADARTPVDVRGYKFITQDDVLFSLVELRNRTNRRQNVEIGLGGQWVETMDAQGLWSSGTARLHGIRAVWFGKIRTTSGKVRGGRSTAAPRLAISLDGGERWQLRMAMGYGLDHRRVRGRVERVLRSRDPLAEQVTAYQKWFDDNIAYFDCPDKWVKKMYYHRWYNLKKNSMWPRVGLMKWRCFAEGRWTSRWFANVISYGAGHQVREARWLRDPSYWQGHLRTFCEAIRPNGIFRNYVSPAGGGGRQYTDWIASTAWDGFCVHPDRQFLADVAPALSKNVEGWKKVFDRDDDYLLVVDSHWWTGMEWQPSFFFFNNYRTEKRGEADLERVDLTSYNYGNAANLARIYEVLGEGALAERFRRFAEKTKAAVQAKMWDPKSRFFYSLRWNDDAKAWVKEIVGIYPFYFSMPDRGKGFEAAWEHIINPKEFWTRWPVASASQDCPAYSQTGWPIGPGGSGCMWNGPTWPHANSLVLTAMARTLRQYGKCSLTRRHLYELFRSYTMAQYRNQDFDFPWTGEYYNGDTGKWKTEQRDYNHSTYNDVLIEVLIGLVPRPDDTLLVDPLLPEGRWDHFLLDGQAYHGRDVTVVWDAPDGRDYYGDEFEGFALYVDGRRVAARRDLGPIECDLRKLR